MKVKYIKRPPPEMVVYRCEFCSTTIKAIAGALEVQHRCPKTRMWRKLKSDGKP